MKKILLLLTLLPLTGCLHDRASWRVYTPTATTSNSGTSKAGNIRGCLKGIIPAFICNQ